jgi:hypothetical protein
MTSLNSEERRQEQREKRRNIGQGGHEGSSGGGNRDRDSTRGSSFSSSSSSTAVTSSGSGGGMEEDASEYKNFLRFSAVWQVPRGQHTVVVKYLAVRMLELNVAVDSTTLLLFILDLQNDLTRDPNFIDTDGDSTAVSHYLGEFNADVLDTQLCRSGVSANVDAEKALMKAQSSKIFFEALIIHPLKVSLTFIPTSLHSVNRSTSSVRDLGEKARLFRILEKVTSVEDFPIKINSFIVDHAMESVESMGVRIGTKTVRELKSQILKLAGNLVGSMTMLGKPAGLYKNIGGGVSDFFYEVRVLYDKAVCTFCFCVFLLLLLSFFPL